MCFSKQKCINYLSFHFTSDCIMSSSIFSYYSFNISRTDIVFLYKHNNSSVVTKGTRRDVSFFSTPASIIVHNHSLWKIIFPSCGFLALKIEQSNWSLHISIALDAQITCVIQLNWVILFWLYVLHNYKQLSYQIYKYRPKSASWGKH